MSFIHTKAVLESSKTKGPSRAILLALSIRADDDGFCWPSFSRIAADSGVARRTVARCLPEIVALGELRVEARSVPVETGGGRQTSNAYYLLLGSVTQSPPSHKVGTHSPQGRDSQSRRVVSHSPKGRDGVAHESPLKNKYKNHPNHHAGGVVVSPVLASEIRRL